MELRSHQPFFRGQHVVIPGVTGAGGIEKSYRAFNPFPHILIIPVPFTVFQAD
jgi:hypothetical protein